MSKVFIALQTNDDTRPIIESILADNPHAVPVESPAMIKIDELHTHLISLSGHIDESDDEFTLHWDN
jgi:phenol/toluene 2-monooxygenase (NADH) P2/A2